MARTALDADRPATPAAPVSPWHHRVRSATLVLVGLGLVVAGVLGSLAHRGLLVLFVVGLALLLTVRIRAACDQLSTPPRRERQGR